MAPFIVNHPTLLNNWIEARENALASIRKIKNVKNEDFILFKNTLLKFQENLTSWNTESEFQRKKIQSLILDLKKILDYLDIKDQLADNYLFNKIYIWSNFRVFIKKDLNKIFDNILSNDSFAKLSIIILSTVIPIYMLMQKDILVVDILIEKASFLLVSIFTLIGFYLEFYILEVTKIDD